MCACVRVCVCVYNVCVCVCVCVCAYASTYDVRPPPPFPLPNPSQIHDQTRNMYGTMVHFIGGDSKISNAQYYAIVAPDHQPGPTLRLVAVPIGPDNTAQPTNLSVHGAYWDFLTHCVSDGTLVREAVKQVNPDRFRMLTEASEQPERGRGKRKRRASQRNNGDAKQDSDLASVSRDAAEEAFGESNYGGLLRIHNKLSVDYKQVNNELEKSRNEVVKQKEKVEKGRAKLAEREKTIAEREKTIQSLQRTIGRMWNTKEVNKEIKEKVDEVKDTHREEVRNLNAIISSMKGKSGPSHTQASVLKPVDMDKVYERHDIRSNNMLDKQHARTMDMLKMFKPGDSQ